MKKSQNIPRISDKKGLQNAFLELIRRKEIPVAIYLLSGIKLQGVICEYDARTILIDGITDQLIFKHAISTILPRISVSEFLKSSDINLNGKGL